MKIIAYLHTHWDREWYRTFEEFRFRFYEVFEDIVKKLEKGEFSQFYLDGQTVLIDDLLEICPEKKSLITELIKTKKIVIGPWYTLADEFLVSGESLIRNLLIGSKQAKDFGVKDFVGYLPDAFGHSAGMVDILTSFGIKNALLWRGAGNKKSEFSWESKSGAQITVTHLREGYFQDLIHVGNFEALKNTLDKIKKNNIGDFILLPVGADHLGACDNLPEKIKEFNTQNKDKIEIGSVFDYLSKTKENLEIYSGELRDNSNNFILQGTYSTRNYLKRLNTLTSQKLKQTEAFAAVCQYLGLTDSYKNFTDYAWKLLLQNQAHDSICGCSADFVHQEMEIRYAKINQLLTAIKEKTQTKFGKGKNIIAFNSSGFDFSGTIEFETTEKLSSDEGFEIIDSKIVFPQEIINNIQKIPVSEDLCTIYNYIANINSAKAMDFTDLIPLKDSDLKITDNSIENNFIGLTIQPDGNLTIKDKVSGKFYSDALIFEDRADIGDTYNFSPIIGDLPIKTKFIKSKIMKNFKQRASLELEYEIQIPEDSKKSGRTKKAKLHKINLQITVDAKNPVLKFKINFENKSKNHIFQAKFNLPEKITKTYSEDSIGLIERSFDPDFDLQKLPPAKEFCEHPTNTAPMQRFVWAQDVGILTKGIHEYEVSEKSLAITLLRTTGMLSGKKLHTRYNAAGPTIPTIEAQCLRNITCEFALTFCEKPESLFEKADHYFAPVIVFQAEKIQYSKLEINNSSIILLALKEAENQTGIVLRLLNISNKLQKTNLTGIPIDSNENPESKEAQTIALMPYELKSVLICRNS